MLNYFTQTDAIVEPVTLARAKQQCRIDAGMTDDDDLISSVYIPAARRFVEKYLSRALFNQTWRRMLDNFPLAASYDVSISPADRWNWPLYGGTWNRLVIDLPGGWARKIVSITYLDVNAQVTTLDPSTYRADFTSEPCRITPPSSSMVWPFVGSYLPGSVAITYEVGSYVSTVIEAISVPGAPGPYTCQLAQAWATGIGQIVDGASNVIAGATLATDPISGASTLTLPAAQAGQALTVVYYTANCPADVVLAILLLVAHYYRNPEATTDLKLDTTKLGVDSLLSGHVVTWADYRPC
jgi:Phage gp6-like head-tail connector protein